MRTAEIFGTEAPIPLCRDPVAQVSEIHRNDMNVMAESIADALRKGGKVGKLATRGANSFTIEALRGFGEYRISFASGVDGEQLVVTHRRVAISHRHDLYRYGFRFFLTDNMCKAIAASNFGSYAHSFEKDASLLLGDFRPQSRGQLEVYHPNSIKVVRKPPIAISEFHEMSNRQTLLIEAIYGTENG